MSHDYLAGHGNFSKVSETKISIIWDSIVWMGVGSCCSGLGSARQVEGVFVSVGATH